jgi:DNA-nicking Smr family endonuclease
MVFLNCPKTDPVAQQKSRPSSRAKQSSFCFISFSLNCSVIEGAHADVQENEHDGRVRDGSWVDLHGSEMDTAYITEHVFPRFLLEAIGRHRVVQVITGAGNHSEGGISVWFATHNDIPAGFSMLVPSLSWQIIVSFFTIA